MVGAGISGLVATQILSNRHNVALFEAGDQAGGHANTVVVNDAGIGRAIDTGFIVYNRIHYPVLTRFLNFLDISEHASDMSFSVRCDKSGLEYNGSSLNGLFVQRRNIFNPVFWRFLSDILKFNRNAENMLQSDKFLNLTVNDFIYHNPYSEALALYYLLPLGSSLWSCDADRLGEFPLQFVLDFLKNHAMLQVRARPKWLTIAGGSRRYVDAVVSRLPTHTLRLTSSVKRVIPRQRNVELVMSDGHREIFDEVILATHADTSLSLVDGIDDDERQALNTFPYVSNQVSLHTDESVLPKNKKAWASWNYRIRKHAGYSGRVTYNMNRLQGIESEKTFCVSLNQSDGIDPNQVIYKTYYRHPAFRHGRQVVQGAHSEFIRRRGISYCGAYWGYGFHEDGARSALTVCQAFDSEPLF